MLGGVSQKSKVIYEDLPLDIRPGEIFYENSGLL
jgi:hypothetical protein